MPPSSASASVPPGIVIPDCCNIGVVFRCLLAVNAAVLVATLMQSSGLRIGLLDFAEASMVTELACLWSLFALCVARRLLLQSGAIGRLSLRGQRLLCGLVPAAVTGIVVDFLVSLSWFLDSFAHLTVAKGMLAAGALGLLFQHYFELRTRAYSPALVEARLQALQARIRPHFLFNSLNAALSLIRSEPRRAENALEDLAELFRVLMSDPRSMTTLAQELRLCRQYLSIEQIRLGERLRVEWEFENLGEEQMRRAQVPVLLLQPLLENAVRYGVEPAATPAPVRVKLARSLDRIEVAVTNAYHPGGAAAGNPGNSGNRIALDNIRERLTLLYDVEAQLTAGAVGDSFEVRLRFPYERSVA